MSPSKLLAAIVFLPALLGSLPAPAQNAVANLGKQRAADSLLEWEIREANHPALGQIRFAFLKSQIVTSVGVAKVFSRPYVSCEKETRKIAIELTHGMSPDDTRGLQPKTVPKMLCNSVPAGGQKKLTQEEVHARWGINELGDVLARGLQSSDLRKCASISIEQDVALPQAPGTARVEFELMPYNKVLDAIFVTCGEVTAYGPGAAAPRVAAAPAPQPAAVPPPAPPPVISAAPAASPPASPPPARADMPWRTVRTIASGKTNVRAKPSIDSAVVLQLAGGAIVTVQQTDGEWWRARSSGGKTFDGYIRQDRLVLK